MLVDIVKAIIDKEMPLISNLSNVSSALKHIDNINWCGFYLREKDDLFLGPFQGDMACYKIPYGKGVCGTSLKLKKTIIVDDVNKFEGHIACSSLSKSEIVVPIFKGDTVVAVIDIDSPEYNRFNEKIKEDLEQISEILSELF